jgi:hypothetical protein
MTKKGTEYKMSERKKNFFGDYLARNEPDKTLCRAGTFGYKSTEAKVIGRTQKENEDPDPAQRDRMTGAREYWIASYLAMTGTLDSCLRRNDRRQE